MLVVHKGWFGWYIYKKVEHDGGYLWLKVAKFWHYGIARGVAEVLSKAGGEFVQVRQLEWMERLQWVHIS